jgi:hypothetical protein
MGETGMYLAQVNIAKGVEAINHPLMADFVEKLDEINALAEKSPGFVWRLKTESGNATDIQLYDDSRIIYNMSVWESLDALFDYTYATEHTRVMANRKQWFLPYAGQFMALWWVKKGELPAMEEGRKRLEYLEANGPSPYAFTFKSQFMPEPTNC